MSILITLGFDDHMSTFAVTRETAEKFQSLYNMDQFVDLCLDEGVRQGCTDYGVFLDTLGDVDSINDFWDDVATALAED